MTTSRRLAGLSAAAIVISASLAGLAVAQDRDSAEVSAYVLTEAKLAKFKQATQNLSALPDACSEEDDDSDDAKSIDQMAAKLNATPGAQTAVQSAGMTTREYVVFTFSIMQNGMAAWALTQPGGTLPPGVSKANVDFFNAHQGELSTIVEDDPCDDESDEVDEEDPEA